MKATSKTPKNKLITLPEDWPPLPKDVISIFGFKLLKIKNKSIWRAGTQLDFRRFLEKKGLSKLKIETAIKQKYHPENMCYSNGGSICQGNCSIGACGNGISEDFVACWCTGG
jgi:hypothetical protein